MSPSVLFSASFLLASFVAWLNQNNWQLILDERTFWIIILGAIEFLVIAFITKKCSLIIGNKKNIKIDEKKYSFVKYQNRLWIILFVELINLLIIIYFVERTTGISNLLNAISYYNNGNDDSVNLPYVVNLLFTVNMAIAFYSGALLIKSFIYKKGFNYRVLFITIIGVLTSLLKGSRGNAIYLIIAYMVYAFLYSKQRNNWKNRNNIKFILYSVIGVTLIICFLWYSATFLGRDVSSFSSNEYISAYLGAEIKNLDTWVRSTTFPVSTDIFGKNTFYSLVPTISRLIGAPVAPYTLDFPMQSINGFGLGNVYTTYAAWLTDFGYWGVFFLIMFMASFSEIIYCKAKRSMSFRMSISTITYGYLAALIALSFFSNKFYENLNIGFIYYILIWLVLNYILYEKEK